MRHFTRDWRHALSVQHITPPQSRQIRSDGVYGCLTAHYHKVSPRNIFGGFKEQAIIVISNEQSNSDNESPS